ncbi:3-hydroxyacyl-ACP dehydratase FabZ [Loigolactobacillus zhaoyuanensis]|uniref:3-hydroxyacyl-ACP dehydratase FabZ n=1 Tax=Loigolactobacillus zhaoyuanensis TaxID=2486017 RepID=A0ABW8UDA1_9LACO|nr:3-hydroxyacyl-ACP dehydratase FabZ [Loigolactobacillus zhaoyuanensis]
MHILDAAAIQRLIPNRFPICYIDHVDELVPDQRITATKNVTINEDFLQGYFKGQPEMPGTLIIETLAQAASILILKSPQFEQRTAYIGSIRDASFYKRVLPGDVLRLEITLVKVKANMGVVATHASVAGEVVCSAELHFVVQATAS